ncbi:hypothetical protein IWZ01DRAFT_543749 [Phyllosticta capitalensis]
MADSAPPNASLGTRLKFALRPKKSRSRLAKKPPPEHMSPDLVRLNSEASRPQTAKSVHYHDGSTRAAPDLIDKSTGERKDITALLHGLQDNSESGEHGYYTEHDENRKPGEPLVASLSSNLWMKIVDFLQLSDAASLAFATKVLFQKIGPGPWENLRLEENHQHRAEFLARLDRSMPRHLLCFPCAKFHLRIQPGQETLKPPNILNPLFECPNAQNPLLPPSRLRLTPHRNLPFTFVQLVMRAHRYGPRYGIPCEELFRRWRDPESGWSHQTRYHVVKGHLLLRVLSQSFATPGLPPSGQRTLLFSREDYTPYFSVCAHWKDGELTNLCKCALNHLPKEQAGNGPEQQLQRRIDTVRKASAPLTALRAASQCPECRSIRRCPECPTEYLVELKLAEDKSDKAQKFKQAISVTRWSDLGDGTTPATPEWAACKGDNEEYDSFKAIGRRAISGTFESQTGDFIPGQRVRSLNPKNQKKGDEGHSWY